MEWGICCYICVESESSLGRFDIIKFSIGETKKEKAKRGFQMKKHCSDCAILLKEVRWAEIINRKVSMYPKPISEPRLRREYNEYRFYCKQCKKEWVYNSLFREFSEVPSDSQFHYVPGRELLVLRK